MNNTFRIYQHFKIIFTFVMKNSQRHKVSIEVIKLRSVFSRNSHEFGLHNVYLNRDGTETKSWYYWNRAAKLDGNLKPKWNCIRYVLGSLKDLYHRNSLGFRWDLNISFPSCSLLRSATLFRESLYHYKENMRHKASAFISFNWPLKVYYFL